MRSVREMTTMPAATIEPMFSLTEASRQIGLPRTCLHKLITTGRLRCFRIGRGTRLVRLSDIRAMIEEHPAGKRAGAS
jgi:hypothetical protein